MDKVFTDMFGKKAEYIYLYVNIVIVAYLVVIANKKIIWKN